MGVEGNFSEYSVISTPVQCFIQTPMNEDFWGRLPNEARRAENRRRKPRSGVWFLGAASYLATSYKGSRGAL